MGIGQRIKEKRMLLGLSQEELGKRVGVTKYSVSKVENGHEENMTLDRVSKYANALNCTESFIMGWGDKELSPIQLEIEAATRRSYDEALLKRLLLLFTELNFENKQKVVTYTEKLLDLQKTENI